MSNKKSEIDIFNHFINNPEATKREVKYIYQYILLCILYLCFVFYCYYNFPNQLLGGVPIFCIIVWILNTGQYFYFVWYKGYKVLDLKGEHLGGWDKI
jgi:hypothetical protein